ncbi:hypothetical protein [Synechococcus sp. CC9311]|nr:hypothetical protein [Synechococcus sp. CC9311]
MERGRRQGGAKDSHMHEEPLPTLESTFTACGDPAMSSAAVSLTIH